MNEAQLFQQLVPLYYAETIGAEHVLRNRLYWNMQRIVLLHTKLPILVGKENSGMQVSLDRIPSMTKKFKNLAMEMAFYQQQFLVAVKHAALPLDYYVHHTSELNALYVLNTSAAMVVRTGEKQVKSSVRTTDLNIIKSFPAEQIENFSPRHHGDYLAVDVCPDLERGVLRSIELKPTNSHRLRLYCLQIPVHNSVIVPQFLIADYVRNILRILSQNEVTMRYKELNGNIVTFNTSLKSEWLRRYCGANTQRIQTCCRNANGIELTLAVVPVDSKSAQIKTISALGICSIVKA